ncbi:MAG TPA: hypothetical protein VG225_13465 [Terracidiphilus sp.]|nr:hypothetical protein [Terracidiphilus sp.]
MKWFAVSAVALSLGAPIGLTTAKAHAAAPPQPLAGISQERPWDQPPDEFRDVQRRGFHDGIESARRDYDHHRRKDADDHERFRHPPVDRSLRDDYRDGFRRGYETAMNHMRGEHHEDHPD